MLLKWSRGNAPNHVTKHFHLREFECGCQKCETQQIDTLLLDKLDDLRQELGSVIVVTSGFRCESHNKAVGGKRNSRHLLGQAADIFGKEVTISKLLSLCETKFLGIGVASTFLHLDVRDKKSRWTY